MIHSKRDLFFSVAFFAKKGLNKGFMWGDSFFSSAREPDLMLFCGRHWRDHSSIQWLHWAAVRTNYHRNPESQVVLFGLSVPFSYISCSPLHCKPEQIITNDGDLHTGLLYSCVHCCSPSAVREQSWERSVGRPSSGPKSLLWAHRDHEQDILGQTLRDELRK